MSTATVTASTAPSKTQDAAKQKFENVWGKDAYMVMMACLLNERRVSFSPEDVRIPSENVEVLKGTDTTLAIGKDPYPAVRQAANRLKNLRSKMYEAVRALKVGDSLLIIPAQYMPEWDKRFAELQQAFLVEAAALKAGLPEAMDLYQSAVMENLTRLGGSYDLATERWESHYKGKFYTEVDFEPSAFGVTMLIRKQIDFNSPEDTNAVAATQGGLTAKLQSLAGDIDKLVKQDPTDGRVKPEARLERIAELRQEYDWLQSLLSIKLEAQLEKLNELELAVKTFQSVA